MISIEEQFNQYFNRNFWEYTLKMKRIILKTIRQWNNIKAVENGLNDNYLQPENQNVKFKINKKSEIIG